MSHNAVPGTDSFSSELTRRLEAAWAGRSPGYAPRTRHVVEDGRPRYTNRLFLESSPYLRQHAHNPVNWFPWGDEAFAEAERLGRPVLLSVGYSTCHWCHVMEEESFEDVEIATFINEHYVAVKVDREERPDVDSLYMAAVQAMVGRGGWPMTVWLTPDRAPFYGGTYFPPRDGDRGSRTGFMTVLKHLAEQYASDGAAIAQTSAELVALVERRSAPLPPVSSPQLGLVDEVVDRYQQRFDASYGGLRGAPKFPSSLSLPLLLRSASRRPDGPAMEMATKTLDSMVAGGMYDQVAGGFHRYSTDPRWLVPHFEKMLYDNALLAQAYLEGWQATGNERYAETTRDILAYVGREMTSPEGAFYSATDADSVGPDGHRDEGWFFTWTPAELEEVLGPERAAVTAAYFGVTERGNFEGRNILNVPRAPEVVAGQLGLELEALQAEIAAARPLLRASRAQRPPPLRDEKVISAWNGLMISAFARAGFALEEPEYVMRATGAAQFLLSSIGEDGVLHRTFMHGQAGVPGFLEDYAFTIAGFLDLFEATGVVTWFEAARSLDATLADRFEDPEGGYFLVGTGQEALLVREKPVSDGAIPSGNSVQLSNLQRLHAWTTDDAYRVRSERLLRAFSGTLRRSPESLAIMLSSLESVRGDPQEVVVSIPSGGRVSGQALVAVLRSHFSPRTVGVVVDEAEIQTVGSVVPVVAGKTPQAGRATAFVCRQGVCGAPVHEPDELRAQLR